MKQIKLFSLLLLIFSGVLSAQKIGVVDTDYILSKMPQYKDAQDRLNEQIANWQTEIQTLQSDFDKKKSLLENERVLLVGDQLKQREKEVDDLDKKIKNMINNRFGTLGEINNARSNLTKPFQDQIWNAIRTVSEKNSLGIVLDKSNNISVIFLEKRYDYTDKVLDLLLKNSGTKSPEKPARSGMSEADAKEEKLRLSRDKENKNPATQSRRSK
ncbi:OmpH family outer membrane protein [Chryseobacterium sp. HSC-36S06]|uniref:OmpH family outer membrane protein n=1 Tax=Chryseobacterium sp. HSC-36S06 TaxID=2910970 RepID=UPI00209EA0BF|nr:OmpH family outer membrane protein [Chryseobacterium sp. HSC-36S06]MCP2037494.1 outer membrane protein [Chryseobacterium sp. HSC-36S06]